MNETQRLLGDYRRTGSESAFRELVGRYLDLVYSVAVRRAEGDTHRAQDIVQTVFSDLARKASKLPEDIMLGGWLHRHCCFVASNVARGEWRRAEREREAALMSTLESAGEEEQWQALAPMLDEVIEELPEPDRHALVLRFFEKRDFRAVGQALGISDDAAQKRVSRALEKLRGVLAARGAVLTVAILGSLLGEHAVGAAPTGWNEQIASRALESIAADTGAFAGLAALLSSFALKAGIAAVALAAIVGTALWQTSKRPAEALATGRSARAKDPAVTDGPQAPSALNRADLSAAVPNDVTSENFRGLKLLIVSAETSEPLTNSPIEYRAWSAQRKFEKRNLTSRADGVCLVALPEQPLASLELTSRLEGYADTRLLWHPDRGQSIPESYTLKLPRAVPIGGTVLDDHGKPVAGAKVGFNHSEDPVAATSVESPLFSWIETTTDDQGRWRIDRIAESMIRRVYGGASHPDYVGSPSYTVQNDPAGEKQLRAGTHVFTLGAAATVRGVVLDENGTRIPEAKVLVGARGESGSRETKSELDGSFELKGCRPGENMVTAEAPQYAPTTLKIQLNTTNNPPVQVVLARGKILRMRIVDQGGSPVKGASVWLNTFRSEPRGNGPALSQAEFNPKSDDNGFVFWDQAPDLDLYFDVAATGFMRSSDIKIHPDGAEHTVTLAPALQVSGTVRDAETGAPVPSFKLITGWPSKNYADGSITPQWSSLDRFWLTFANGKFQHAYEEPVIGGAKEIEFIFKIEAEGYAPYVSRVVNAEERKVVLDAKLKKAEGLRLTVLQPDGTPAANTDVQFAGAGDHVNLAANGFERHTSPLSSTDNQGQLVWLADDRVVAIYAANGQGFAMTTPAEVRKSGTIQLQAWGKVEGTYTKRGRPVAERGIVVSTREGSNMQQPWLHVGNPVNTDSNGKFTFERVPPGKFKLAYLAPSTVEGTRRSFTHVPFTNIEIASGQTATINYDDKGVAVQVRIVWPEGVPHRSGEHVMAILRTPTPIPPPEIMKDREALKQWWELPENKAVLASARHYMLNNKEGELWTSPDVAPGEYLINFNVGYQPAPGATMAEGISGELRIAIPENWSEETFDAGRLEPKHSTFPIIAQSRAER